MSATTAAARPRYCANSIPAELREFLRWVVFLITCGTDGKSKKVPLIAGQAGRHPAKSNDPRTWRSYDVALADAEARGLYLAFAFDRDLPYFFLDADAVVQPDGTIRPDVVLLRDQLDTYTEYSVSGSGLHIVGRGALPKHSANRDVPPGRHPLERYPLNGGRFCLFTGHVLPGFETIYERTAQLAVLFPPRAASHANGSAENVGYRGPAGALTHAETEGIVEWAAPFWTDGRRHQMALHLSGYLGKQRVAREQAVGIIERCAADDSDPGAKITACHDTFDNLEAGMDVSGWHALKAICGLRDDDLVPLNSILEAFWHRSRPRLLRVSHGARLRVQEVRRA